MVDLYGDHQCSTISNECYLDTHTRHDTFVMSCTLTAQSTNLDCTEKMSMVSLQEHVYNMCTRMRPAQHVLLIVESENQGLKR